MSSVQNQDTQLTDTTVIWAGVNPSGGIRHRYEGFDEGIVPFNFCNIYEVETSDSYSIVPETMRFLFYQIPESGITLKKPIDVIIEPSNNYLFIYNEELDIHEGGSTWEEALKNFNEFFLSDLKHWAERNDDELTEDAQTLKAKFMEFIT
jgi:hypothetical protein